MSASSVGAYEAKTHLPRLLDQVEAGESVVITKHGRPVARLVPIASRPRETDEVIAELIAARAGVMLGDVSLRELIDEGRR